MPERERVSSVSSEHEIEMEEENAALRKRPVKKGSVKEINETGNEETAEQRNASIEAHNQTNFLYRRMIHRDAKFSKLATHEDPYHFHKTFGILSICSFFYRYGYCFNTQGTLGFSGDINDRFDWGTMVIHLMLAFSSIIFRVPKQRIADKPLVIYEEYRQHAMVFTLRCFSVFAVCHFYPEREHYVMPLVVMSHHLLADFITWRHGNGSTAVRASSEHLKGTGKKTRENSKFYERVAYLYSFYQFLAIASHILPNDRILDLAYNAIIAIASSAFMMTLYRKRVIRALTHMFIYSGCLVMSAFHICRLIGWWPSLLTLATFMLRINLPRKFFGEFSSPFLKSIDSFYKFISKYVLWTSFYMYYCYDPTGHKTINFFLSLQGNGVFPQ